MVVMLRSLVRIRTRLGTFFFELLYFFAITVVRFITAVYSRVVTVAIVVTIIIIIIIIYLAFTNFLTLVDRPNRLPRKIGKELSLLPA